MVVGAVVGSISLIGIGCRYCVCEARDSGCKSTECVLILRLIVCVRFVLKARQVLGELVALEEEE